MAAPRITREQLAKNDVESLMLNPSFLRFLSTVRFAAGIERTAYGPEERHLHFMEGRRSLWCDILRTAEQVSPDAILHILSEEMKASKETTNGRRTYDRLKLDDDGDPGAGRRTADDADFLYGNPDS